MTPGPASWYEHHQALLSKDREINSLRRCITELEECCLDLRKTIEASKLDATGCPKSALTATEIPMPEGVFGGQIRNPLSDDPLGRKLPHPESDAAKLAAVVDAIQLRIRMAVMAESSEHQSTSERLDVTRQKLTLLELLKVAQ